MLIAGVFSLRTDEHLSPALKVRRKSPRLAGVARLDSQAQLCSEQTAVQIYELTLEPERSELS